MALILITGLPGAGKTLYTLAKYKHVHEPPPKGEGRQVFHCQGSHDASKRDELKGIPGLALPWTPWHPSKWADLAPGSLLIIDEAQFVFPVRPGRGEPPDWIAALAVHRHSGVDIVLITQHPTLIDTFVRRLCDQHFHVKRKFGTHWAVILESPSGARDNPERPWKDAVRHEWRYPKSVFGLYTSAEAHTVKRQLPMRLWVLVALPFVLAALVYVMYLRMRPDAQAAQVRGSVERQGGKVEGPVPPGGVMTVPTTAPKRQAASSQWVSNFAPRVAGLPHTAPAFDELTKPQEAPYPAYCVSLGPDYPCKCYTQRATLLQTPRVTCESIATGGFFAYWTGDRARRPEASGGTGAEAPVSRAAVQTDQAPQGPLAAPGASIGGADIVR